MRRNRVLLEILHHSLLPWFVVEHGKSGIHFSDGVALMSEVYRLIVWERCSLNIHAALFVYLLKFEHLFLEHWVVVLEHLRLGDFARLQERWSYSGWLLDRNGVCLSMEGLKLWVHLGAARFRLDLWVRMLALHINKIILQLLFFLSQFFHWLVILADFSARLLLPARLNLIWYDTIHRSSMGHLRVLDPLQVRILLHFRWNIHFQDVFLMRCSTR